MISIERTPVTSSNVAAIAHDEDTLDLSVWFIHGTGFYVYHGVPTVVAQALKDSESGGLGHGVGAYLQEHVKGVYQYTKMSE